MWVLELHTVLVEEVLGDGALDGLPVLQLQRERLRLRRPPRHVAHLPTRKRMMFQVC